MRLRSFVANSLPEAMRLVRRELGPEAVILSTDDRRRGQVRVTAALESSAPDMAVAASQERLSGIETLSEALTWHGVPARLSERLLTAAAGHLGSDSETMLGGALAATLSFGSLPGGRGEEHPARRLLLMGTAGAGKTATAAKLCARARLAGTPAHLVTLDVASAGARAQAEAFAEAIGVPLSEADSPEALGEIAEGTPPETLLVIDSEGANPFSEEQRSRLAAAASAARASGLLVLPAGGDPLECAETACSFAACGASLLLATRVDTTRRYGGILAAAEAAGLALLGAGVSPAIGGGLTPLAPLSLASLLLPAAAGSRAELMTGTEA